MGLLAANGRIGGSATSMGVKSSICQSVNSINCALNNLNDFSGPNDFVESLYARRWQLMEVLMLHKNMSKAEAFEGRCGCSMR